MDKDLRWVGSSLDDQRALPPEVRRELGFDLRRVQQSTLPRDWKPIKTVGPGVIEIRVHVGGALRNGCTVEEIQETLLQAAIYCGVPAAMEAFRVAEAAIERFEAEPADAAP